MPRRPHRPNRRKTLDIYITDTEGGKATLFVSPTGETVLIDTGNPQQRDLDRILAVFKEAGVKQIDHLILTHYHVDHVGGLQELAKQVLDQGLHRSRTLNRDA